MENGEPRRGAKPWHIFAALCAAGLLLYWPSFGYELVRFDDEMLLRFRDFLSAPYSWLEVFRRDILFSRDGSALYYRPLAALLLTVQARLDAGSLFVYRFTNLALHVVSAWFFYRFFCALRLPGRLAGFLAFVFLLHPAAAQVVCWLPGSNNSLLAAFLLPAFLFAAEYLETGRRRAAALHWLLFTAAMFIKESAVGLAPACLLYCWLVLRRNPLRAGLPLYAGWVAGFGLWMFVRSLVVPGGLPLEPGAALSALLANLPAVAAGAGYALAPFGTPVLELVGESSWGTGLAALALLSGALLLPPRGDLRRAVFGALWFLVFLLPGLVSPHAAASNFMPQRIYLSLPGLLLVAAELPFVRLLHGGKMAAAAAALLLLLAASSFRASSAYAGPLAFWSRAVADSPSSPTARVGYGTALNAAGRLAEAEGEFRRAVSLAPSDFGAAHNLGVNLASQGRYPEALLQYERALELKPDLAEAYLSRGNALAAMNRPQEALAAYGEALRIAPHYAEAHYQAGFLLAMAGNAAGAEAGYRAAIGFRPSYADAHLNLGTLLAAQGRQTDALMHYGQAIRLRPDIAEAYYNRGVTLGAMGRGPEAAEDYKRAILLKPGLAEARVNLGLLLAAGGAHQEALGLYYEALRVKPGLPVAHNSAGISLYSLGRYEEALSHFNEALRLAPAYADPKRNVEVVRAAIKKGGKP